VFSFPTSFSRFICLPLVLVVVLAACGGSGQSDQEVRPLRESIHLTGFYADMNTDGFLAQRILAETAEYDMAAKVFLLENVKVEFFDGKGGEVVLDELYADNGVWYTADRPQHRPGDPSETVFAGMTDLPAHLKDRVIRNKSDLEFYGDVFYRVIESGSVLLADELLYDNITELLSTETGVLQVKRSDSGLLVLRAKQFTTDKDFTNPKYSDKGLASIENVTENIDARYAELVPNPPAHAPSFDDYEK
jgi:hypothetical protein